MCNLLHWTNYPHEGEILICTTIISLGRDRYLGTELENKGMESYENELTAHKVAASEFLSPDSEASKNQDTQ